MVYKISTIGVYTSIHIYIYIPIKDIMNIPIEWYNAGLQYLNNDEYNLDGMYPIPTNIYAIGILYDIGIDNNYKSWTVLKQLWTYGVRYDYI